MRYLFYNPINASTFGPNTNSSRKNIAALGLGMGFDDTVKGQMTAQLDIQSFHSSLKHPGAGNATLKNSTADYGMTTVAGGTLNRNMRVNPIFGYNIVRVKAVEEGTTIYRLKRSVFDQFLHFKSIKRWHEKEIEAKLPS